MQITSSAFENGEMIPKIFTCDGKNISPHLIISDVPPGSQSLALIMEDPDAVSGLFTHWLIWNMPPSTVDIPEGGFVEDAIEGLNSAGRQGYTGPCPPSGTHRYFFNLCALDITLDLNAANERDDLEAEIKDHIVDQAKLLGLYRR